MDDIRFDAWTRRRFGIAAGGAVAALIALVSPDQGAARKKGKKKKKRCLDIGVSCTTGGRPCCGALRCDSAGGGGPNTFCCKTAGSCRFGFDCCFGWACEASQCVEIPDSDRALKSNFATVDPADILQRVRGLPVSTWNDTADDPAVRHVGPMAQDFAVLFGVGADDRHIHPLDGQGVALAAIQGLLVQIDDLQADHAHLAARVAALERSEQRAPMPYDEAPAQTT